MQQRHWALSEYLISQVLMSASHQFEMLKDFYPLAHSKEWTQAVAGQRVQIIKPGTDKIGTLEFGTELIASRDQSIAALLGASPGASTATYIALQVLQKCFGQQLSRDGWLNKLQTIIPTYGIDLRTDAQACFETRQRTAQLLHLDYV